MRILTWNIQSSGTIDFNNPHDENIQNILQVIETLQAEIVVIQEFQFKYYDVIVREGFEKMGYKCSVCKDNKEKNLRYRVLIATKFEFDECDYPKSLYKYSRRNWNEIIIKDSKIVVLGIDVPLAEIKIKGKIRDNKKEKKQFLEALKVKFKEYSNYRYPAIILGDFNLHEKAVYKEYLQIFRQYLLEVTTEEPTWGKYRFDYIFVNSQMADLIDKAKTFGPHSTTFSDHKYLYIDTEK